MVAPVTAEAVKQVEQTRVFSPIWSRVATGGIWISGLFSKRKAGVEWVPKEFPAASMATSTVAGG